MNKEVTLNSKTHDLKCLQLVRVVCDQLEAEIVLELDKEDVALMSQHKSISELTIHDLKGLIYRSTYHANTVKIKIGVHERVLKSRA